MDFRPRTRFSASSARENDPEGRANVDWGIDAGDSDDVKPFRARKDIISSRPFLVSLFLVGFIYSFWIQPLLNDRKATQEVVSETFLAISESHDGISYRVDPTPKEPSTLPQSPVVDVVIRTYISQITEI